MARSRHLIFEHGLWDAAGSFFRWKTLTLPLENINFFSQVATDLEAGTIGWPNGVDFCPNVLYAEATGKAITELGTELEVA